MKIGAVVIIMIVAVMIILTFYVIGLYNKLFDLRNRVYDKFKSIAQELNKVIDKLQELIEIIGAHTKHEDTILSLIVDLKSEMFKAKNINEKINAYNKLCVVLEKLEILSKTYSKLKSNKNFISLKKNLDEINNKITYSSSFYNNVTFEYNKSIKSFPSYIVSYIFKFKQIEYINRKNEIEEKNDNY